MGGSAGMGGASGMGGAGGSSGMGGSAGMGGMGGMTTGDCTKEQPDSLYCKPTREMPNTIKETGLFPSAPDFSKHGKSLREFKPSPELWSDGMGKQRFILLPEGKKVDNSDRMRWAFPIGTIMVKTFFDDSAMGGKPRPIETRFIRRVGDLFMGALVEYDYYVYKWNADGTDAMLIVNDEKGDPKQTFPVPIVINRMVDTTPLKINDGTPFMHDIPSRENCGHCHTESGMMGQTFIGFDELRLNSKLTPTSTDIQLKELADLFMMPVPATPATITDNSNDGGRLLRIKRAIFGNCAHCHNGGSVFDLRPEVFVENTVKKASESQSVKPPAGWLRVVPGSPDTSVVFRQVQRVPLPMPMGDTDRLRPMPPVGVADIAVDKVLLEDLRAWILALPK
jgi:hypothetical protein